MRSGKQMGSGAVKTAGLLPRGGQPGQPQRALGCPQAPLGRHFLVLAGCAALLVGVPGCSWWNRVTGASDSPSDDLATTRPATTQFSTQDLAPVPPALQNTNRPVVQGPLPLVYLVEADGTLRVRNVETTEEIITFEVKMSQIVRVETRGVLVANKPVIGANLAPGQYAIEFVYPDAGAVRSNQLRTGPIPNQ